MSSNFTEYYIKVDRFIKKPRTLNPKQNEIYPFVQNLHVLFMDIPGISTVEATNNNVTSQATPFEPDTVLSKECIAEAIKLKCVCSVSMVP